MTEEETLEKLRQMKLHVMTQTFQELLHAAPSDQLSFGEKFGLIVDREWTARENRKLDRLLRAAKLTGNASAEDVVCSPERGLEKSLLRELATCRWVHAKQNVIVVGKTGVGKSFIGCALATTACRKGYRTLVTRVPRLVQELAVARAEGSYATVLARLAKLDILILDDFLLAPLKDSERRDLLEVLEDRYDKSSTIITSQVPTKNWHELIGDPTIADAICDRLIHNAHLIALRGPSMRQRKQQATPQPAA
jgi:DNA replication protein DnaC